VDDPSLLVPVDMVWKERRATLRYLNREFESPQERLLTGLGMAARMFPPIEGSLRQARPQTCSLKVEEAYQFLSETSLLLQQNGFGVLAPPWWTEKKAQIKAKVGISTPKIEGGGFFSLDTIVHYDWQLAMGDELITPEELQQLATLKVPLVQRRGEWVLLRPEDIKSALQFFKKHNETQEMSLKEAIQLNLSETPQLEGIQVEGIESSGWLESLVNELKSGSLKRLRQPKEFAGKLRPYQLRGLSWLAFMRQWGLGACLADDMGLGKTIQVIALLLREQQNRGEKSRPNLLICPTSVVGNWKREVARFAPSLKVMVHHGSARLSGEQFATSSTEYDLVVTSYGLAHRDADDLTNVDWKGIMLDEAQNIKNPSSKTAQAVRGLRAEYRFALTGTPIKNRLMELWSIMEFLNPGYLHSQKGFHYNFVLPIERYGDEKATKELKAIVAPFILRRLKTDPKVIRDLPQKQEMKVYCNLTREQVTLYEAAVKDMLEQFETTEEESHLSEMKRRGMILSALTKLKQLCNHPALFLRDHSELEGRSGKLQRLVEMLYEILAEGDKALIFTQFSSMGELLREYLENKFRRQVLFLHGGVPQKKRDRMVSVFQEEQDGPPIFLISVRAGGTGLNLTRANHVFHFDRWWNPAVEDQATDRAFRIGQTKNVQVHKFICAGTLEEQIDELIERKKTLTQSIVGAGEDWLTELSTDELRKIITLRPDEALSVDER
jgi:SNF2 family DNA or RNA helicase